MILWLAMTVMVAIAAVFVSAPFIRQIERARANTGSDVAVYRDQLKEIDHEASLGLIDAAQAESARTEIKRRILVAGERHDSASPALSSGERTFAAVAVAGVVVLGSVGLFALTANLEPPPTAAFARAEPPSISSPEWPSSRSTETVAPMETSPIPSNAPSNKRRQTSLAPVEELVQRVVSRLQRNPGDIEGWRLLGWSYLSTDHFSEAAAAYARAIELKPDSAEFRDGRTEALIRAANGVVTAEATSTTEDTLKLHPKDPRARYFKGLAIEQAGDKSAALKEWNELLAELDPNDAWTKELKQKIAAVESGGDGAMAASNQNAADHAAITAAESLKPAEPPTDTSPMPEDVRNAQSMTPSDRGAMIRQMVEGLAARLEQSPRDADGWIKLIRSRSVLGETEKAKQALAKALKVFDGETAERNRITATSEELGLNR